MGLIEAQCQPGRVAAVVGVCVGVGSQRAVAQVLQVADQAVGVVQVQPVEGGNGGHQHQRVAGQHLVLAGIGAAAYVGADGVAVHSVGQVLGNGHDLGVGLQIGHEVKVVEALGQHQNDVRVVGAGGFCRGGGKVLGHGGRGDGGVIAVVLRLNDGVGHQAGGLDGTGQVAVLIIGILPGPTVGGFGLDRNRPKVAEKEYAEHTGGTTQYPHTAGAPAGALGAVLDQLPLHKSNCQHRQIPQNDGAHGGGNLQCVAAHDLGGGAQVQDVLGHQGRAVQIAGIVVDECDHGEQCTGDAGGAAPLAQDGKQHQCQAEGGQGVQRGVQRPLHGQKVRRNAVGQFQLIPRNKCGSDGQCKGQDPLQEEILPVEIFQFLHGNR